MEWRQVVFRLQKIGSPLAMSVADSIKNRESHLLESRIFLAAVWVDSRARLLLSEHQKDSAKAELCNVHARLQSPMTFDDDLSLVESPSSESEASDFQAYLDSIEKSTNAKRPSSDFDSALVQVEKLGRLKKDNVFDIIECYPEIVKDTARVVSSLPSTQVSVERLFSQLKLILRDNRSRMEARLTDAILFLRTNKFI